MVKKYVDIIIKTPIKYIYIYQYRDRFIVEENKEVYIITFYNQYKTFCRFTKFFIINFKKLNMGNLLYNIKI